MYAIVDIEASGSHHEGNAITEIAIVLHNGKEIEGKYETLINPLMPIDKYVQKLTGITDKMVSEAPTFSQVAPNIYNLLTNRVFVAHNVSFDYAFVQQQLLLAGYKFNEQQLCTQKLAKKVLPNMPKFGLDTLCRELNIKNNGRHRAGGDAFATAQLFSILLANDTNGELKKLLVAINEPKKKVITKKHKTLL